MERKELAKVSESKPFYFNQHLIDEEVKVSVDLLEEIMFAATQIDVSDIHLEPLNNNYRIRVRIDGTLIRGVTLALSEAEILLNRIKLLANLDVAKKQQPQDGRLVYKSHSVIKSEFRVSSIPTAQGEKLVLRKVNSQQTNLAIEEIGLAPKQLDILKTAISHKQGLIIVTGPTGAGKSMTLYSCLNHINSADKNLCTVEDPVELQIDGVNQLQVDRVGNLDFSNALKALLRQDPDVLMVGEIRDLDTAQLAIRAGQTGHLVLSTLHANTALGAITRLKSLGISNFELAESLSLLIAQRLVKKLCQCKEFDKKITKQINGKDTEISSFRPKGCAKCHGGYRGRSAVFEVVQLTAAIKQSLIGAWDLLEVRRQLQKERQLTLYEEGLNLVDKGVTSLEELNKVIGFV